MYLFTFVCACGYVCVCVLCMYICICIFFVFVYYGCIYCVFFFCMYVSIFVLLCCFCVLCSYLCLYFIFVCLLCNIMRLCVGRNMTSLHHAAPPSLAPVALGDILVGGVLLISRKIEDMVASEHPVQSWKYALHMAALSSCKIYIIFRSDWWPMCVQGVYR